MARDCAAYGQTNFYYPESPIIRLDQALLPQCNSTFGGTTLVRDDRNDQVFKTTDEKYTAVIADIRDCTERGQPVLVGTTSIENSELLSGLLHGTH